MFTKSKLLTVPIILISLIIISAALVYFLNSTKTVSPSSTISSNHQADSNSTPLEKNYAIDTDGDKIPDFIESQLNLDPNKNEVTACLNNKCDDPSFQAAYVKKHNVVIILDSSGSMALNTGSVPRMDAAKQAIESFIKEAGDKANIGLIVYGHLGSNSSKDKALSCSGAEILSSIGSLNATNVSQTLSTVKPTGWTNIGLAILKSQELFVGKEKDINEVFVVTDGAETCDTNPSQAATILVNSPAKVKINVIGFAISQDEIEGLKTITTAGNGSFETANNAADLEDVFNRNSKNWTVLTNANNCIETVISDLAACTVDLHNRIDNFRNSYINPSSPTLSREELAANESVYYSFITYLQSFQSQTTADLIKKKNDFVNKL